MVTRGFKQMVVEANAVIDTVSVADALVMHGDQNVVFVDIRETVELQQSGSVSGAVHAPRGFLEFMVDPEGPLHKPELAGSARLLLFCASGGRSALAAKTLVEMGVENVAHIAGGFSAWQEVGGPVSS
ncbi:MAG: sulfurtransferase [Alphaproteobacteria bacterium]|nr:sulfurtransferase [Alphaproteobacteria bacterium]|tara:strand:- start:2876 stop:3259 length:384 start_codon:yes stop_codon:yes gene_type:complete